MGRFGVGGFGKDPFSSGAFGIGPFGVGKGGTQVMISQATGTPTDNFQGRNTAWYDGITSQGSGAASFQAVPTNSVFMKKDWGAGVTKIITGVVAYGSNDADFSGGPACNVTIVIDGSNDDSGYSTVATFSTFADGVGGNGSPRSKLSGFVSTAYRYHRATINIDGVAADMYVAEVQFYETI